MDLKGLIESLATGWAERLTILVPLALIGALGLYVAWLLIGYLRASQAGIEADAVVGEAIPLDSAQPVALPAGAPYCLVDGLVHPVGAEYCARCEADLARDCATCGTTIRASDAVCYSCGARQ
ncbi:MAG: double zinc ribbon domain-containing protein [Candidatus Limnocylindria bacterium]